MFMFLCCTYLWHSVGSITNVFGQFCRFYQLSSFCHQSSLFRSFILYHPFSLFVLFWSVCHASQSRPLCLVQSVGWGLCPGLDIEQQLLVQYFSPGPHPAQFRPQWPQLLGGGASLPIMIAWPKSGLSTYIHTKHSWHLHLLVSQKDWWTWDFLRPWKFKMWSTN